jgi:putative N6-adenine-specific DNA methylase
LRSDDAGPSGSGIAFMENYMKRFELIAPCHFGLEAVLKREIIDLGYEISSVEDGRVSFYGDPEAVCRANIFLRTAERVLVKVGSFRAETFEELFDKTKALPWEEYIPKNGKFWVTKAASVKSKLFSPSDIQSIMKKAMVKRLQEQYHVEWFPEDGASYPVRVFLMKDEVTIGLDTSGVSLHKRGYREVSGKAPITETLAAALILLTPWRRDRILVDPFCGSGTFPIEAAMMAANMAPGMNRSFLAEEWTNLIPKKEWYEVLDEANDMIDDQIQTDIQGYDVDPSVIRIARRNAREAGVDHLIHFQERDVKDLRHPKKYGFIITNPPYGERLEDKKDLPALYKAFGDSFRTLDSWSAYMITSYEDAERYFGRKADRNRKIYNGMLKTYYYQFLGPKPPRRKEENGKG